MVSRAHGGSDGTPSSCPQLRRGPRARRGLYVLFAAAAALLAGCGGSSRSQNAGATMGTDGGKDAAIDRAVVADHVDAPPPDGPELDASVAGDTSTEGARSPEGSTADAV